MRVSRLNCRYYVHLSCFWEVYYRTERIERCSVGCCGESWELTSPRSELLRYARDGLQDTPGAFGQTWYSAGWRRHPPGQTNTLCVHGTLAGASVGSGCTRCWVAHTREEGTLTCQHDCDCWTRDLVHRLPDQRSTRAGRSEGILQHGNVRQVEIGWRNKNWRWCAHHKRWLPCDD